MVLVLVGLGLGLLIGIAVKLFAVETDPRIEQVEELLPNANCGACGFAGCADFARAMVGQTASAGQCPSTSDDAVKQICALLGTEASQRTAMVAVVKCGGNAAVAQAAAHYNGISDCRSASLVASGAKNCLHGCLGLGTCARACPFGAIEVIAGLAVVHPELCTGCAKCVATCPRNLIEVAPASTPVHILCNSPEKGAAKMKVCKAACIGCRKCLNAGDEGQIQMAGFLAKINYDNPPTAGIAASCPTKCLQPVAAAARSAQTTLEPCEVTNG